MRTFYCFYLFFLFSLTLCFKSNLSFRLLSSCSKPFSSSGLFCKTSVLSSVPSVLLHHSVVKTTTTDRLSTPPVILLHGLLGSSRSLQSFAKLLHFKLEGKHDVISFDLRNHGQTSSLYGPLPMNYRIMAEDVI
jgi:predicted alpha/beta-fold hydrolase